jgi:hypothetical protein
MLSRPISPHAVEQLRALGYVDEGAGAAPAR